MKLFFTFSIQRLLIIICHVFLFIAIIANAKLRATSSTPSSSSSRILEDERWTNYGIDESIFKYPGVDELSMLLYPITVSDFMKKYFEQKVLHVKATDSNNNKRVNLFSREQLNEILNTQKIYNEISTRFVIKDEDVDDANHKKSYGEMNDVYDDDNEDAFNMGHRETIVTPEMVDTHLNEKRATMLFKHLEMHVPKLKSLTCSLANGFGAKSGVNMYLTPPKAVGFLTHYDGHDLFVTQTEGQKCWHVCERHEKDQLRTGGAHFPGVNATRLENVLGVKCRNITLRKGDMLYLPRGTLHAPHTHLCMNNDIYHGKDDDELKKENSMHISISLDVTGTRWTSLFDMIFQTKDKRNAADDDGNEEENEIVPTDDFDFDSIILSGKDKFVDYHWTWRHIMEEMLLNMSSTRDTLGRNLRKSFPVWLLRAQNILPRKDIHLFESKDFVHTKISEQLYYFYYDLYGRMKEKCEKVIYGIIYPTLLVHGWEKNAIDTTGNATAISKHCSRIVQEFSEGSLNFGIHKLLGQAVQTNNMKCSSNAPVMIGMFGAEASGDNLGLPPSNSNGNVGDNGEVIDSYNLFDDVEGQYDGSNQHATDEETDSFNLHGNDEKLLKDSLVEFHKDLTILVFNDKDINIPPANYMAFPKIISIVGIIGPWDNTTFFDGENTMKILKNTMEEKNAFPANKHSFELTKKLFNIGTLKIVKKKET
jgi:hypothetical protein